MCRAVEFCGGGREGGRRDGAVARGGAGHWLGRAGRVCELVGVQRAMLSNRAGRAGRLAGRQEEANHSPTP